VDRIFRSCLQIGSQPESDDAYQNWLRLKEYGLEFQSEEDRSIFGYLDRFYDQMSAPPDFSLVREYFEKKDDIEVTARLDEVKKAVPYIKTNFVAIVRAEREQQQVRNLVLTCRDASAIAEHGRNLDKPVDGKKVLRGVQDALGFLFDRMSSLTTFESGEKLEGVVSDDADEFLDEYDVISKTNKYAGRNLFGLEPVDSVCEGHKSGEFWVHCASPGELKTTAALNYAYNNAFVYGKNIFYCILEMPYRQLRRQLFTLHSSHGKFVADWYEKDRRAGVEQPYLGLDYRKIRDGRLSDSDLARLKTVAQDFKANSKGKLYIWKPPNQATIPEIHQKAEMFHNKYGCDGIVIDYLGLVKPKHRTSDAVDRINGIVTDARMLALNFARGKGTPVLALFQINRQGKLRADKAEGRYDFAAIAYANQIEKDADVITYTYLNDQLRKDGKFYLGAMKVRDNPIFERMTGKILWQTKRMRAMETGLLDMNNDRLLSGQERMSLLTPGDMIT
jgi:replicative DNA helicase